MDSYPGMMNTNVPMSISSQPFIKGRGAGHQSVRGPGTPRSQKGGMTPRSLTSGSGSRPTSGWSGSRPTSGSLVASRKNRIQPHQSTTGFGSRPQTSGSSSGFLEPGNGHLSGVLGTLGSSQKRNNLPESPFSPASTAELLCDVLPVTPIGKHRSPIQTPKTPGKKHLRCWPGLHEALEAAAPPSDKNFQCWAGLQHALEAAAPLSDNDKSPQSLFSPQSPFLKGTATESLLAHVPPPPACPPPGLHQTLQQESDCGMSAISEDTGVLHSETKLKQESHTAIQGLFRYLQNPLPPMKSWLKREISKVSIANTRSTSTLKSIGSAKALHQSESNAGDTTRSTSSPSKRHIYSEEEAKQAIFLQQQFPGNTVLRGELQEVADEAAMKKIEEAHMKWDIERRCRQADRQRIRHNREMKLGREQRLQREEQRRKTLLQQANAAAIEREASQMKEEPVGTPKSEVHEKTLTEKLMPVALGFMKILKPQQPLQTRLKMINRLAASKQQPERASGPSNGAAQQRKLARGSTGTVARKTWGVLRSAVNCDDKEVVEPPWQAMMSPESMKLLKDTFHRYDKDESGALESNEILPAVQDCGICPKVRKEKRAVNQIMKEVVTDCGRLGLDFDEFVTLIHRLRTKIADVQRAQLESLYMGACDEKGTFNINELPSILGEVAHVQIRETDLPEIFKEFGDFQTGRKWLNPEEMEVLKKKEQEAIEKRKLLWTSEQSGSEDINEDEDLMKDFDAFEIHLTRARERLGALIRDREREISEENHLPEEVFREFRPELIELDELFRKYDVDDSGCLDENEVRQVLTDFGCMPKTVLEQKMLQLMFWDIKFPNKPPPEEENLARHTDIEFDFTEFLTLVRRLRKMNADMLKASLLVDFNRYDRDKSGELEMHEVAKILHDMGLIPRTKEEQAEILAIFEEVDEDGSQSFDFKEFQVLIIRVKERLEKIAHEKAKDHAYTIGISSARFKEILTLFRASDEDGNNMIWVPHLRVTMDSLGKVITSERLHEIFEDYCAETDGQKYLGITEFCNMMKDMDNGKLRIADQKRRKKVAIKKKVTKAEQEIPSSSSSGVDSKQSSRSASPIERRSERQQSNL